VTLQNKGTKFNWSQKCQDSFNNLKELLTSTPILKVVDPNKYFIVCVDASKEGLDGVLTKKWHVIFYESQKLKEHERNYVQMDGQTERKNQIIEDMLRMYVRTKPNKWKDYLNLV
jgi:hypothetical protein